MHIKKGLAAAVVSVVLLAGCGGAPKAPTPKSEGVAPAGGSQSGGAPSAQLVTTTPVTQRQVKIVLGGNSLGCFTNIFLAQNAGLFKEFGLDVSITTVGGGNLAMTALSSKDTPIGIGGAAEIINFNVKGRDLRIFAGIYDDLGVKLVLSNALMKKYNLTSDSPIEQKVKALKGAKVGVTNNGEISHSFVTYLMKKYGMDGQKDVDAVALKLGPSMVAAMKAGQIDAFSISSPAPEQAVQTGLGQIAVDPTKGHVPEFKGMYYCAVATRPDVMEQDPALLINFSKALVKVGELLKDKEQVRKVLRASYESMDAASYNSAFDANYELWSRDPEPTQERVGALVKFWSVTTGSKESDAPFDKVATSQFVKQAKQELGIK